MCKAMNRRSVSREREAEIIASQSQLQWCDQEVSTVEKYRAEYLPQITVGCFPVESVGDI